MANQQYSDEFKAKILSVYEVDGPAAARREFKDEAPDLAESTLIRWAKAAGAACTSATKVSTEAANTATLTRRLVVREKLLMCVELILDDICVGSEARERKDNAMAAAILLDKFRLEQGEPTGREEVRHEYADRPDDDLIREAESILRGAAHQ